MYTKILLLSIFVGQLPAKDKTVLTLDGEFIKSDISLLTISKHVSKTAEIVSVLPTIIEKLPDTLEGRVISASVKNKEERFLRLEQVK